MIKLFYRKDNYSKYFYSCISSDDDEEDDDDDDDSFSPSLISYDYPADSNTIKLLQ